MKKVIETKHCDKHDKNYLASLEACPYCLYDEEKAMEGASEEKVESKAGKRMSRSRVVAADKIAR